MNVVYLCLNGRKIEGNRLQVYLICRNSAKYLILIREKAQFWIFWPKLILIIKNRHIPTKIAIMVENKKLQFSSSWWKMTKWVIIYDSDSLISTYHQDVLQFHKNLNQLCPNFRWIRTFSVRIRLKFGVWISFDLIFGLYT